MVKQKIADGFLKYFKTKKSDFEGTLLDTELEEPNYFT